MARVEDRKKVIELRTQGKSYSQIKLLLGVSKSTLSNWLDKMPLTKTQLISLRDKNPQRIENFRNTMMEKRLKRDLFSYNEQKDFWTPLTDREKLLSGIFLYWGEGTKVGTSHVCLSNSNPKLIKFYIFWLNTVLKIPKEKITVRLHLYNDMNIDEETNYWVKELSLPMENFKKPYIKKSLRSNLSYKSYGHGTCNVLYFDSKLKRRILKSIEAISDSCC